MAWRRTSSSSDCALVQNCCTFPASASALCVWNSSFARRFTYLVHKASAHVDVEVKQLSHDRGDLVPGARHAGAACNGACSDCSTHCRTL